MREEVEVRVYAGGDKVQLYALFALENTALARFSELSSFNSSVSGKSFPPKSFFGTSTKKDIKALECRRYLLQRWLQDIVRHTRDPLLQFMEQQITKYGKVEASKCRDNSSALCKRGSEPLPLLDQTGTEIREYDRRTQQWPVIKTVDKSEYSSIVQRTSHVVYKNLAIPKSFRIDFHQCVEMHYKPWDQPIPFPLLYKGEQLRDKYSSVCYGRYIFHYNDFTLAASRNFLLFDLQTAEWLEIPYHQEIESRFTGVFVGDEFHFITYNLHFSFNTETKEFRRLSAPSGVVSFANVYSVRAREYIVLAAFNAIQLYNLITEKWEKMPNLPKVENFKDFNPTGNLLYDDYSTIYVMVLSSTQTYGLFYYDLDLNMWNFGGIQKGSSYHSIFIPNSEESNAPLDEKFEAVVAYYKQSSRRIKYSDMYSNTHITKENQEILEAYEKIPVLQKLDYFRNNETAMMDAFRNIWKHDPYHTASLLLVLLKEDPEIWEISSGLVDQYVIKTRLANGESYICPSPKISPPENYKFRTLVSPNSEATKNSESPRNTAYSQITPNESTNFANSKNNSINSNFSTPNGNHTTSPASKQILSTLQANHTALPATETLRRKKILQQIRHTKTEVPIFFICPITKEIMFDPVVAKDGNSYERTAIMDWFEKGNQSTPQSTAIIGKELVPNNILLAMIQKFLADNDLEK